MIRYTHRKMRGVESMEYFLFPCSRGLLIFLLVMIEVACAPSGPADAPEDDSSVGIPVTAPTLDELSSATYEGLFDYPVTLTDGRYEGEPFVEGGASAPAAGLVEDFLLTCDLDGDGREEAVVLLWESSGGSGTPPCTSFWRGISP